MESSPSNKPNKRPNVFGLPKHRERVISAISDAFSNNDLDIEDYEKRLEMAHDAKSLEELRQAVYDFPQVNSLVPIPKDKPVERQPTTKNSFPPAPRPSYAPSPAESFRQSFEGVDYLSVIGDRKLTSLDITKPNIKIVTGIGEGIIDLREIAQKFTHIRIENYCGIGNLKVRVPHNAQVSKSMFTVIGDTKRRKMGKSLIKQFFGIKQNIPNSYDPNQPEVFIEISGIMLIGDLVIEYMPDPGTTEFY